MRKLDRLDNFWHTMMQQETYFDGFPVLSENAANRLAIQGIKGIDVDAISVDSVEIAVDDVLNRIVVGHPIKNRPTL